MDGVRCPLTDPAARPVIAHRGGAGLAPENTLAAFERAQNIGADAIELDVRMSADGEVAVIHDPTLDRTTTGRGHVGAHRMAGLERLGVPRLADVLAAVALPVLVEIKERAAALPTLRVLERAGAVDRAVVAGAACSAVAPLRGGRLRTGACTTEGFRILAAPRVPPRWPFDAFCTPTRHLGLPLPMGRLIRRALAGGAVTHVWTVDDPAHAIRLWTLGAHGIVTDRPDLILAARAAAGIAARG